MGFEVIAIAAEIPDPSGIDYQAIRELVSTHLTADQLQQEWGQFTLPDGSVISCCLNKLKFDVPINLLSFGLHGFTELQVGFIWRIAHAADMAMVDTGSGKVLYLTRPDQQERLAKGMASGFEKVVYCGLEGKFMRELTDGMKSFVQLKKSLFGDQAPHVASGPGQWVSLPSDIELENRRSGG